ncbi:MAG: leucine-rich repeat domain-containing protein [Clostridia bacterium]|nr:leucine-rich repeat domain-containing protein [Clostridia bacterium]
MKQIVSNAFEDAVNLKSITIPDSVTRIGQNAFRGCTNLESISLPFVGETKDGTANTHFGYIFGASTGYNNNSYVPASLKTVVITGGTSIAPCAFYGCKSLTSVTIPDGIMSVGNYAFYDCTSLSDIAIPAGVESIGTDAFANCTSLTYNEYGNAYYLGKVNNPYFILIKAKSSDIASCEINENAKFIHKTAFYGCYRLVEVYNLSSSITVTKGSTDCGAVGYYALSVHTDKDMPSRLWEEDGYVFYEDDQACYLITYEGNESVLSLPSDCHGKNYAIYRYAFYGCSNLTSITIPDGVTDIGDSAFCECSGLQSITIPESVESIGEKAFFCCNNLTSITIPDGITRISNSAFSYCSSLTDITIPNSVTIIGAGAFAGCSGLTSITIPAKVENIDDNVFCDCSNLTSVAIPDGVTRIGESAFAYCRRLTSITIPDGITSIGNYAFAECGELTSVTIPDGIMSIGIYAFRDCSGLTYNEYDNAYYLGNANNAYIVLVKAKSTDIASCEINEKTKFIHAGAFGYCTNLESIVIPDSVKSISEYMFVGCSSLTSIVIPDSVKSVCNYAFRDCSNLTSIFYGGAANEWIWISIDFANNYLKTATRYYYSETEPVEEGKYWHYDGNGDPVAW